MPYNVLDIFSGAGGLMLGFEQMGFNIVLSTDIDEDCEKVHKINRPDKLYIRSDRDEPKLWNKFDIMQMATKTSYFYKNEGYKFDWHRISDLLISGSQLLYG